jgi:hypothetical protein
MGQIKDLSELSGLTIKNAINIENDDSIGVVFTDGSYCAFTVTLYGDSHDMVIDRDGDIDDDDLMDMGVISQSEYDSRCATLQSHHNQCIEDNERRILAELKAKYEQ